MKNWKKIAEKQAEYFELAKKTIRAWHDIDHVQKEDEEMMWGIYERNSPEMKRLNELEQELQAIESQEVEQSSAEEILNKHLTHGIDTYDAGQRENIIRAMQEYSNPGRREIIEDWMEWYYESEIDNYTKKHIKKYLKLKI